MMHRRARRRLDVRARMRRLLLELLPGLPRRLALLGMAQLAAAAAEMAFICVTVRLIAVTRKCRTVDERRRVCDRLGDGRIDFARLRLGGGTAHPCRPFCGTSMRRRTLGLWCRSVRAATPRPTLIELARRPVGSPKPRAGRSHAADADAPCRMHQQGVHGAGLELDPCR